MSNRAKTEVGITGLGIMLGTLGVLLPHCSPLALLGVIISAIGFGMIIAGAISGSGRPPEGLWTAVSAHLAESDRIAPESLLEPVSPADRRSPPSHQ